MISTTCNIVNSVDKNKMTLCTTWSNTEIKIMILRNEFSPLIGEAKIADLFLQISTNFRTSENEYLNEIRQELSGQNDSIVFSLKDNVLSWKKKMWIRGKIVCKLLENTEQLSTILLDILVRNSVNQETAQKVTEENERLKKRVEDMEITLREMTRIKNEMEDQLYKNFIVLLNTKKRKIRQLEERISNLSKDPVYDMATDGSDNENVNEENVMSPKLMEKIRVDINENSDFPDELSDEPIFTRISKSYEKSCLSESDELPILPDDDDNFELRLPATPEKSKKRSPISLSMEGVDSEDDSFFS